MSQHTAPRMVRQATQLALAAPLKLPIGVLWAYGLAAFGQYAADLFLNMFLQIFLLDTAGVPAFYTGIITAVAELVEVLASVVIGILSDKTKSRYGARRPWIFWGSVCGSLTILLLFFTVPSSFSGVAKFVFYLCAIVLTSLSFPSMAIPHQALASEITDDYDQRLNLATSRSAFSFAGMLLMTIFIFIVFTFGVPTGSYQVHFPLLLDLLNSSLDHTGIIVVMDEVQFYSTKTFCGRLGGLFCLPPFVIVVVIFALCGLTQSVTLSLFPLFIVHVLGFGMDVVSQVLIVMIGMTVLCTFGLSRIGHRYEKKTLLSFGCAIGIFTYALYFWIPGGFVNALVFTLPNAMMADVTDLALLKHKAKQEGLMFSAMETFQSVAQALVGFLINWHLDNLGYVNSGTQPAAVQIQLRYFFCCIPAAVYFLVWILSTMYSITRERHRRILKDIKKLKEEIDVTGDILGSVGYTNLATGNLWDAKRTLKLQRDKAKIVQAALTAQTSSLTNLDGDGDPTKWRNSIHPAESANALNPILYQQLEQMNHDSQRMSLPPIPPPGAEKPDQGAEPTAEAVPAMDSLPKLDVNDI